MNRTAVFILATVLLSACNLLPVSGSRKPAQIETRAKQGDPVETPAACNCALLQQTTILATEPEIKQIQARLILLGYPAGDIDGVVGNTTRHAIKAYQTDHKLLTDGRPSTELLLHIKATSGNVQTPSIGPPGP
jgi:peptidoglycan hydrolase-like protein with peptidoglycan-binding domain